MPKSILVAVVCVLACAIAVPAHAQPAMPKTIKIVVPFSPGGSNDIIARAIAAPLAKRTAAAVIVENKAGAAGVIGADAVAKAPRDGSVLLLTSSSFLTAAATQAQLPFDPVNDLLPVAMVGQGPLLLAVSANAPYRTPAELISAARASPGALNYGTAGVGSVAHLATELMNDAAKIRTTHVPYKGAANAVTDLAAGQIQLMLSNYSTLSGLMKGGKLRALAVTSAARHPAFTELPPLATAVPGYALEIWVGVFAPAGTPAPIVERLNRELNEISASSDLAVVLEPDGTVPTAMSPPQFALRVKDDLVQWKQIATTHHIVAE